MALMMMVMNCMVMMHIRWWVDDAHDDETDNKDEWCFVQLSDDT